MVDKALLLLEHSGVHKKYLYIFALIVFSITCAVVFDLIFKAGRNEQQPLYISIEDCNVQQKKCLVDTKEFSIEISMDENIFYLKRFNIGVIAENNESAHIKSMKVSFKMKSMNMGNNHFLLNKVKTTNNKEIWEGTAVLPVCITGRADWTAVFDIITGSREYLLLLPLSVTR